jgi:hypothetical protein
VLFFRNGWFRVAEQKIVRLIFTPSVHSKSEELVMKLTKIALGVTLGLGGLAVNAADVAMFPYVVTSDSVTTIISVIDSGDVDTGRYNPSGVAGSPHPTFNRLHWRLNYKAGSNISNTSTCSELDYHLPSSPNDIQTVDLGDAVSGSGDLGVLFNDPSVNNNWRGAGLTYAIAAQAGNPVRGVLFVHNSDASTAGATTGITVQGEAMVFEFQSGAAWGYKALLSDSGTANDASDFDFSTAAAADGSLFTFMPLDETTTKLFVTPVNDSLVNGTSATGNSPLSMLGANGASIPGWDSLTTVVSLGATAGSTSADTSGVAFDRDENLFSGSVTVPITCVGAVGVSDLMTSGAQTALVDGGYTRVYTTDSSPSDASSPNTTVDGGVVIKLEYGIGDLNGQSGFGVFNNAFQL